MDVEICDLLISFYLISCVFNRCLPWFVLIDIKYSGLYPTLPFYLHNKTSPSSLQPPAHHQKLLEKVGGPSEADCVGASEEEGKWNAIHALLDTTLTHFLNASEY